MGVRKDHYLSMFTRTHVLTTAAFGAAMLAGVLMPLTASADSYNLTASPNPCTLTSATGSCTSVITWNVPAGEVDQLWVSTPGMADAQVACVGGPQAAHVTANWIVNAGDNFRVYKTPNCSTTGITGLSPVATLSVMGSYGSGLPPAPGNLSVSCPASTGFFSWDAVPAVLNYRTELFLPAGAAAPTGGWTLDPTHAYYYADSSGVNTSAAGLPVGTPFTVEVYSRNSAGYSSTFASKSLTCGESTPTYTLAATPTSGTAPLIVTFTGSAPGGTMLDFGDNSAQQPILCGGNNSACLVNATHTYPAGTYVTSLKDTSGVEQKQVQVTVNASGPSYSLTAAPSTGAAPLSVTFSGSAPINYIIDYGDGSAPQPSACGGCGNGPVPVSQTHTYAAAGTYTAKIEYPDRSDVTSAVVTVTTGTPPTPVACVNISQNLAFGSSGTNVTTLQNYLISRGYLAAGNNSGFFGFKTKAAVSSMQIAMGILPAGDPYLGYVGPRTRAALACSGTHGFTVAPASGFAPFTTTFTGSNTGIVSPLVDFGDGTNSGAIACGGSPCSSYFSVPHTYQNQGTYAATLKDATTGTVAAHATVVVTQGDRTAPWAVINPLSLVTTSTHPLLKGTAANTTAIDVSISKNGAPYGTYRSVPVVNGMWSVTLANETYSSGSYAVVVTGPCGSGCSTAPLLATGTLYVSGSTGAYGIHATPNPCQIADGQGHCLSSISWTAPAGTVTQMWVQQQVAGAPFEDFSCQTAPVMAQTADWITAAGDKFSLYVTTTCDPGEITGKTPVATLVVMGTPPANPVPSALINSSSLTTTSSHPTITGTAANTSMVSFSVSNTSGTVLANLNALSVTGGAWSGTVSSVPLIPGSYSVKVYNGATAGVGSTLATGTLTVGGATPTASLTVQTSGGTPSHEVTINPGDSLTYVWAGTNVNVAASSYTIDSPDLCPSSTGSMGPITIGATPRGGTSTTAAVAPCRAGHTYTVVYKVTAIGGQTAQDSVTIHVGTGGTTPTLSVSPTSVTAGNTVAVSWSGIANANAYDWFGLYPASATTYTSGRVSYSYVNCKYLPDVAYPSGTCPTYHTSATMAPGNYKFVLFKSNSYVGIATTPLTVTAP